MADIRKCIVWDLDNTLWDGVCLEGPVTVREDVVATILELDGRGILHSIASRGDEGCALSVLRKQDLERHFLVPRINWLPKSQNIVAISRELGLALDAMAFVDDDPFEREQVAFMLPDVRTIDAARVGDLALAAAFSPAALTRESRERRLLYQAEEERRRSALRHATREDFLRFCGMRLGVRAMRDDDIPRVCELMTRTHQLNTTGRMFDPAAVLNQSRTASAARRVVVAELQDLFGGYGIIGTAVTETRPPVWRLVYLAISCRVMGRGVERALLAKLAEEGLRLGATILETEFRDTGQNPMMRALYQMAGFRDTGTTLEDGTAIFRAPSPVAPEIPGWVEVT